MKNTLYILLFLFTISSCEKKEATEISYKIISDTLNDAVTPLTGFNDKGQPYIWWVEKIKDSDKNIVFYALSEDMGNTFSKAIAIPITSGCNDGHGQGMPRLIFKKDGTMVAVYSVRAPTEANSFAGKILYAQSFDRGITWSEPSIIHSDTLPDNGHAFPALTVLTNGEVGVVWLDGRNKLPYSELFMAQTEGKNGFTGEKKIGGPSCQCCKLDFYTDANKNIHVLYRGIMGDNIRDIMRISSSDNGSNFSEPVRISDDEWKIKGCPHAGPGMALHKDSLHYVWFTMGGGEGIFYCSSDKMGSQFSQRKNLAGNQAKYPQVISLGDSMLVIAWQEYSSKDNKDYNRIKIQLRTGDKVQSIFASEEGEDASHPAILALGNKEILLAYEQNLNGRSVISYKKISL